MKLLFIHKGFPGQFKELIPKLRARGDHIITITTPIEKIKIPQNVHYYPYHVHQANGRDTFPLASELETKIIRGEAVAREAEKLLRKGLRPDLIVGHPGWGEMLFLGDIWPNVPQLHYLEFFYGVEGTDNNIDDEYGIKHTWKTKAKARIKNTNLLANLEQMHIGLTPTKFQYSLLPLRAQKQTSIIHDGIDTEWLCPNPKAQLKTPSGLIFNREQTIITFINRTFEPYRGIHIFLKALAKLQAKHPSVQALLVGEDTPNVSYGNSRDDGQGWLSALRNELGESIDWGRVHHLGLVNHSILLKVFQISSAHIYLSYPFVLSWSMLEAMSSGTLTIGSATPPVMELIKDGKTGLLVPFNDCDALADTIFEAISNPSAYTSIKENARKHIQTNYNLNDCVNSRIKLIDAIFS